MVNVKHCLFALLFLTYSLVFVSSVRRYPEPKTKAQPRPKPPKLNTDHLPKLQDIIEDLGLSRFLKNFIKMGVTETRLLIRLTSMDFRMMAIEWDGISDEEITRLKGEVASLFAKAVVVEEEIPISSNERDKIAFGRVYITDSVQNFEYMQASFGGPAPLGQHRMVISESTFGCEEGNSRIGYNGSFLVALRGNCTFLDKALNAKRNNASALIIVNTEDRLESPASGLGINKTISDSTVLSLSKFPIVAVANISWAKLKSAMEYTQPLGTPLTASIVPLKCHSGGNCRPVTSEEGSLLSEVSWGKLHFKDASNNDVRSFDFLTSNFGSLLPTQTASKVVLADPVDACEALRVPSHISESSSEITVEQFYANAAVVVYRGGCRFDSKALTVQAAGARIVILVDIADNALQRIGGMAPEVGFVGIPSVIITAPGKEYLSSVLKVDIVAASSKDPDHAGAESPQSAATYTSASNLYVEFVPATDSSGADRWIDLAFTTWNEQVEDRLLQLEGLIQKYSDNQSSSAEIVAWLHRRVDELTGAAVKHSIASDEL